MSLEPSAWTAEEDLLGFFGPDSITWRVHADPTFTIGGLRALLLQALHPLAMAAASAGGAVGATPTFNFMSASS